MSLKMPERKPSDGKVSVERCSVPGGYIVVNVVTDGDNYELVMSEHNAWRVFGMLSLILGIPQTKAVGKAIKL
jgi:hypothetical protein